MQPIDGLFFPLSLQHQLQKPKKPTYPPVRIKKPNNRQLADLLSIYELLDYMVKGHF